MRLTLLVLAAAAIAGHASAQCVNGRCYSGSCPQTFAPTWVAAAPQQPATAADGLTWDKVPQWEKDAYTAARKRVEKGETVILCCGPYGALNTVDLPTGVPGLARGFHKCYLIDGVPKAELIRYDDPAVEWVKRTGPGTLTTDGENRFPLTPKK